MKYENFEDREPFIIPAEIYDKMCYALDVEDIYLIAIA